ncbi:MAG: tRNA uridine-5-carboxymethylaminomethyl(34) synthesis enzyme MnmG [Phycisphaerae bacterium]
MINGMGGNHYDVIVVGGGHAGAEAAWAAGRLGARTAMVTFERGAIGRMSCNPAIGGIGKGQMVREIDALGGLMGLVADETGIQFRMLNRRKGPAVWAPRCQSDSRLYAESVQKHLSRADNLEIVEGSVEEILFEDCLDGLIAKRITGVTLQDGRALHAHAVIITSGTFLRGLMHCGEQKRVGGRVGEAAAVGLSASLQSLGLELARLKTGTPPRVARDSVDFSRCEIQPGDDPPMPFSHLTTDLDRAQVPCWITYTNDSIHSLLRENLHRAPMYSGQIESRGPRYCPSIEDKIVRFADKTKHQVFLEPEGRESDRIYVNGVSTSMPRDVQARMIAAIPGLENARVLQWGYAVEYDFVPPEQVTSSLMTKRIAGLFLAGQINGTSGYEEAAGQGLMAGVNAARFVAELPPVVLGRDEAYIGVMVDDLVTRGVMEPYRMFTSRAEYRLQLRYDNADQRLTPIGRKWGLICDRRWAAFCEKRTQIESLRELARGLRVDGELLEKRLRRPEVDSDALLETVPELEPFRHRRDVWTATAIAIKYAGYLDRQDRMIEQFRSLEAQELPTQIDYAKIPQLRREAVERLVAVRPASIGQASRISGVQPTDISILMVYLASRTRRSADAAAT